MSHDQRLDQFLTDFDDGRASDIARLMTFRQEVRDAREGALRVLRGAALLNEASGHENDLLKHLLGKAGQGETVFADIDREVLNRIVLVTDTILVVLGGERMTVLGFEPGVVEANLEDLMRELLDHAIEGHDWSTVNPIEEAWRNPPEEHASGMCQNPECSGTDCADPRAFVFNVNTERFQGQVVVVRYWTPEFQAKLAINGKGYDLSEAAEAAEALFGEEGPMLLSYAIKALGAST